MIYFILHKKMSDFNLSPYVEYSLSNEGLCLTNNLFMTRVILKLQPATARQFIDILETGGSKATFADLLKRSCIAEPQNVLHLLLQKGIIE